MLAVVLARMSSRRLPGKALRILGDKTILEHVVERVNSAKHVSKVVVATSTHKTDDAIVKFCLDNSIDIFRGDLLDVTKRFMDCASYHKENNVIRISGDSPLINPDIIEKAIKLFKATNAPLVSNVCKRTFPKGQSVEIICVQTLKYIYGRLGKKFDRENITASLYLTENLNIQCFENDCDLGHVQMSVDTEEDMSRLEFIERNPSISDDWVKIANFLNVNSWNKYEK